jgi:hypothetical protein
MLPRLDVPASMAGAWRLNVQQTVNSLIWWLAAEAHGTTSCSLGTTALYCCTGCSRHDASMHEQQQRRSAACGRQQRQAAAVEQAAGVPGAAAAKAAGADAQPQQVLEQQQGNSDA